MTKMVRIAVTGVAGRMGAEILRAVRDDPAVALVSATEQPGSAAIGLDAGLAARLGPLEVAVVDTIEKALKTKPAVVIDFTSAQASLVHAAACAKAKVALVVGSTGFHADARVAMKKYAEQTAIVMAPNMSVGVNLMFRLAAEAAKVLGPDYDAEVLEAHHKRKKDSPSGTALRLAEVVAESRSVDPVEALRFSRHGDIGERPAGQIGVQTLRGGDVVGEHTVFFFGEGERLEITHRATSRDQFARGAVRASRWVAEKPPGLYSMQDVLGF